MMMLLSKTDRVVYISSIAQTINPLDLKLAITKLYILPYLHFSLQNLSYSF